MTIRFETRFVPAFTDIDATELASEGLSTAWQLAVGISAGVALIVLAFAVGILAQRRGNALDEARKAELRAAAETSGAVSFTDLDLSDDSDFDLGVPTPPAAAPANVVPEYL